MYYKLLGDRGEEFAVRLLEDQGFQILATKYRCRSGEIDVIAKKQNCVHFVEVKTRWGNSFGHPAEAVTEVKQNRMKRAAQYYLMTTNSLDARVEFDVVTIEVGIIYNCI